MEDALDSDEEVVYTMADGMDGAHAETLFNHQIDIESALERSGTIFFLFFYSLVLVWTVGQDEAPRSPL